MSLKLVPVAILLAVSLLAVTRAFADTPVPACRGHNPAGAASARAEGLKHYRLSRREGPSDAEMATALGFFEASCAAGDDGALELRAYALAGVERFVEAAQSLDAFLVLHPLDTLAPDVRARVAGQQPQILARVATLTVRAASGGARVLVNHQPVGTTPLLFLRLAPGRYDVEVMSDGSAPQVRSFDLAVGEHTESFPSASAAIQPATSTVGVMPEPHHSSSAAETPPSQLRPWVIGSAVGGGVFLAAGIAGTAWANERSNTYNAANCGSTAAAGCSGTLSQYNAAHDLEVAGFVGAGLGLVASGVLFYVDRQKPHTAPVSLGLGLLRCTVPGAAVVCRATF